MSSKILLKTITEFRKSTDANPQVRLARNAAVRGELWIWPWTGKHFAGSITPFLI